MGVGNTMLCFMGLKESFEKELVWWNKKLRLSRFIKSKQIKGADSLLDVAETATTPLAVSSVFNRCKVASLLSNANYVLLPLIAVGCVAVLGITAYLLTSISKVIDVRLHEKVASDYDASVQKLSVSLETLSDAKHKELQAELQALMTGKAGIEFGIAQGGINITAPNVGDYDAFLDAVRLLQLSRDGINWEILNFCAGSECKSAGYYGIFRGYFIKISP